jgi:hypothetical protein
MILHEYFKNIVDKHEYKIIIKNPILKPCLNKQSGWVFFDSTVIIIKWIHISIQKQTRQNGSLKIIKGNEFIRVLLESVYVFFFLLFFFSTIE